MQTIARRLRRRARPVRHTGTTRADVVVTGSPPDAATDRICAALERMTAAWNAADATAYGARFTEDATCVTWVGTVHQGRGDITAGHAALFAGLLKGVRLDGGRFLSMDFPNPGTARVVTRTGDGLQFLRDPGSVPSRDR